MKRNVPVLVGLSLLLAGVWCPRHVFAQAGALKGDKAAMMVLDSARRAYNDGKYAVAAERFTKFLQENASHKEAPSARYGLGLALMDQPKRNYAGAIEALRGVIGRPDFANRTFAIYYMGVASRGYATDYLAKAAAEPAQAHNHRSYAASHFSEAARNFAAATDAFVAQAKATTAPVKAGEPSRRLWADRARCDWCDMLLRTGKFKLAAGLAETFLADKATAKSPLRPRMLYYLGYARFAEKNYLEAGRLLSQLAPFDQEFGVHTRYLLARTHHLARELPEAAALYKAVVAGYEKDKADAVKAMQDPRKLTSDQRRRAEALISTPQPDYVTRASFYAALVAAESGQFPNAQAGFAAFVLKYPKNPLAGEAQLRQGYCHLLLRSYAEAIKVLDPLRSHKQLGDRATWWLARARVAGANPADAPKYAQTLKTAMAELTRAAQIANERARHDATARVVRGDIMIELADTQQLAGLYKEAAATYYRVLSERSSPDRDEEVTQRMATAQHLSGDYGRSNQTCDAFEKKYPKSTLLPNVWFRKAENACLAAVAAADAKSPSRRADVERLFERTIVGYHRLLSKFPDFSQADLARYGMATAQYRLKRYTEAVATLSRIPDVNHTGELAPVAYLMADCLIRTLPAKTDDALSAAKLMAQAAQAAKLLAAFVNAEPKSTLAPDALLKLGHCHQRIGAVLAKPADKKTKYTEAQQAYEKLLKLYAKDPLASAAFFERAKCRVLLGDTQTAMDELMRFRRDPYRATPVAALALVRLSGLLRALKRQGEAADILAAHAKWHKETKRTSSRARTLGPDFLYEQALATKDSGKPAEARAIFESVIKTFPKHPEAANALWRAGQCQREELVANLAAARKLTGGSSEDRGKASRLVSQSLKGLSEAAASFAARTKALAKSAKGSEAHLRMTYETAWCYRILGDREVVSARGTLQKQAVSKVLSKWPGPKRSERPKSLNPPPFPRREIPLQPSEKLAQQHYRDLIAAAPQSALAGLGRFELAELLAARGKDAEAIELLETALENTPPKALAQRIRLRLAASLVTANRATAAMGQIRLVAGKTTGVLSGQVRYLTGEAYIRQKNWAKAVEQLAPFIQTAPYYTMPDVADRALLRLGYAYAQSGKWNESRQAMETLVSRFGRSPWIHEARYGVGLAWQNQKNYVNAASLYRQVTGATADEIAAQAQIQLGACLLVEKKLPEAIAAFLVVPYTYDYPEHSAEALFSAAQAHVDLKQPADAAKLWQRVVKDHPASQWATSAAQRLAALKPTEKK